MDAPQKIYYTVAGFIVPFRLHMWKSEMEHSDFDGKTQNSENRALGHLDCDATRLEGPWKPTFKMIV
jgi:hypothetical protein